MLVLIAALQVVMGWLQYDESKRKRIEAEEVLVKAQKVFTNVSSSSIEMKHKVDNVMSEVNKTVIMTQEMADNANKNIIETKKSFNNLAVNLTIPVASALALHSDFTIYMKLKDKIEQINTVGSSLKNLGIDQKGIDEAISPFMSMITYRHVKRILHLIDKQLPNNKKKYSNNPNASSDEWSLNKINKIINDNKIKPSKELQEAIKDLEYFEKYKKLRHPDSWQG
jgi:hypothetical protein